MFTLIAIVIVILVILFVIGVVITGKEETKLTDDPSVLFEEQLADKKDADNIQETKIEDTPIEEPKEEVEKSYSAFNNKAEYKDESSIENNEEKKEDLFDDELI